MDSVAATATVVTCYYRFPSKHRYDEYDAWSRRFLTAVDTPMVIFCDAESAPRLAALRDRPSTEGKTRVIVLPLEQTRCGRAPWVVDASRLDPEAAIHTPSLYVVWNEKAAFVARVMAENPFATDAFAWCDIGCVRADPPPGVSLRRWPEGAALDALPRAQLALLNVTPFERGDFALCADGLPPSFDRVNRVGGTIQVGHRAAWERWIPAFYATLDRFVAAGRFAGKDQNVMAALCVLEPDAVRLVRPSGRPEDGDPWFYLLPFFAAAK